MSSYVNKKTLAFRLFSDCKPQTPRTDGRMKSYLSATDARAWCDITEDKRQYILELIKGGCGGGIPPYKGTILTPEQFANFLIGNKETPHEMHEKTKNWIKQSDFETGEKPVIDSIEGYSEKTLTLGQSEDEPNISQEQVEGGVSNYDTITELNPEEITNQFPINETQSFQFNVNEPADNYGNQMGNIPDDFTEKDETEESEKRFCDQIIGEIPEEIIKKLSSINEKDFESLDNLGSGEGSQGDFLMENLQVETTPSICTKCPSKCSSKCIGKLFPGKCKGQSAADSDKEKRLSLSTFEHVCICAELFSTIQTMASKSSCAVVSKKVVPQPKREEPRSSIAIKLIKQNTDLTHRLQAEREHNREKMDQLQIILDRLNRELYFEKERNDNLMNRYSNQAKTVETLHMQITRDRCESNRSHLDKLNEHIQKLMDCQPPTCPHGIPTNERLTIYQALPHICAEVKVEKSQYSYSGKKCSCSHSRYSIDE